MSTAPQAAPPPARVFGLIPAAGISRRMGQPKQLLPWKNSTMLETTAAAVMAGGVDSLVIVTNPTVAQALGLADEHRFHTVILDDPDAEMIDSIIAGVAALRTLHAAGDDDAFLVCPGDLPRMTPDIVRACAAAYRHHPGRITAAATGKRLRHPIVVPFAFTRQLTELRGVGLHGLLDAQRDRLRRVALEDCSAVEDIDTPTDYLAIRPTVPLALEPLLRDAPVLVEGAMGTMLMQAGLPSGTLGETLNRQRPELVADIHRQYAAAGVRIHFSNTFNGNRYRLTTAGLGGCIAEVNRQGAAIARAVAGNDRLVGGTIGPTGEMLAPLGRLEIPAAEDAFAEQASALVAGGADLLWIETMLALPEALAAVAGCRRVSDRPVAVTMTFSETPRGYFTMMGHSVSECVRSLEAAGVAILGANCQLDGAHMIGLAKELVATTRLPVAIQPNAGQPRIRDGKPCYAQTAEEFAEAAAQLAALGVSCIGGCCGTTPTFLAAARARLCAVGKTGRPGD